MGIEVYNQQNAVSDDPYVLVLKLYEGVIKYLSFVKGAMQDGEVEKKFTYINKTIAIFDELRNVLDFDAAGIDDNINAVKQVIKVTQGLIDAWKEETGL